MLNKLAYLGQISRGKLETIGRSGIFLLRTFVRMPDLKRMLPAIWRQLYAIGVLSCLVIVVAALFVGMVIGLQGYNTLQKFGASNQLGQLLALSIVRELGPVLSALLFAGRAGSALTAEIGLMKATEQLASMDMMGVDPLQHIIYPRFIAGFVALPLLTAIFSAIAIYGGYLVGVQWLSVDSGGFWSMMQSAVHFHADILSGMQKSLVFAFIIAWIALFQGINCIPTAAGVSQATTRTVVYSSLAVLGADFLLTVMMIGYW